MTSSAIASGDGSNCKAEGLCSLEDNHQAVFDRLLAGEIAASAAEVPSSFVTATLGRAGKVATPSPVRIAAPYRARGGQVTRAKDL